MSSESSPPIAWWAVKRFGFGWLVGLDRNGLPIWQKTILPHQGMWITNDITIALHMAVEVHGHRVRCSNWLLKNITPYRITR